MWRAGKNLKREMGENTQDGTPGSWFKVTVSVLARPALDRIPWNLVKKEDHIKQPYVNYLEESFPMEICFHWRV